MLVNGILHGLLIRQEFSSQYGQVCVAETLLLGFGDLTGCLLHLFAENIQSGRTKQFGPLDDLRLPGITEPQDPPVPNKLLHRIGRQPVMEMFDGNINCSVGRSND